MTTKPRLPDGSHAVLIGVSAYEHPEFPSIRAARNSLDAMRTMLCDPALCGWPPERVTVIANPLSGPDLAGQVSDLAETTTGVLLLYYVGHGALSTRGELCLTVTATRPDRPKITGLPWDALADVLRASPARARIAILDCCFAGQAIEALASSDSPGLADITHTQGVYTLTATTRNRTAHVPPPDRQDTGCTSFTGALRDLLHTGIPHVPSPLTLGDIYPVLRARLRAQGLPTPNQRGTDTAGQFPFATNRATQGLTDAEAGTDQSPAGTAAQMFSLPTVWTTRLFDDALRIAHAITDEDGKTLALARIAGAIATVDPARGQRLAVDTEPLASAITDDDMKYWALARIAGAIAVADPDRAERLAAVAERLAHTITDESALSDLATALAVVDPDRAERLTYAITDDAMKLWALARVAGAMATVDPERAERLVTDAIANDGSTIVPVEVARALAVVDPDRAERLAYAITDDDMKPWLLARVAGAMATVDPARAEWLAADAERLAHAITDDDEKAWVLAGIVDAIGVADPARAERLADDAMAAAIIDDQENAWVLADVARAIAVVAPDRAERLTADAIRAVNAIADDLERAWVLAGIADAIAVAAPDRAERLAFGAIRIVNAIADEGERARRLVAVTLALTGTRSARPFPVAPNTGPPDPDAQAGRIRAEDETTGQHHENRLTKLERNLQRAAEEAEEAAEVRSTHQFREATTQLGADLNTIPGTVDADRIRKQDIINTIEANTAEEAQPATTTKPPGPPVTWTPIRRILAAAIAGLAGIAVAGVGYVVVAPAASDAVSATVGKGFVGFVANLATWAFVAFISLFVGGRIFDKAADRWNDHRK
jgi:hypothetical protein